MKNLIYYILSLFFLLQGCKRNEPDSGLNNPPNIQTLSPIQIINLGPVIREPSGIIYNHVNNSLMVVSDDNPNIFEIDFNGNVIRTIPTTCEDLEGITITKNCDTIVVVEETRQLVTSLFSFGQKIGSFPVNVATMSNHSLEGITIDKFGDIFVLNEKSPTMVLQFRNNVEISRHTISSASDISDICYDATDDSFWIISDESMKIMKFSRSWEILNQWLITFDKGEGITFANNKMYIVRDSDAKMYVYNKP